MYMFEDSFTTGIGSLLVVGDESFIDFEYVSKSVLKISYLILLDVKIK
jgi:hypothetical protein